MLAYVICGCMITNRQLEEFKKELAAIIDIYKKEFSEQKPTDWKTYEKHWANRLRTALKEVKRLHLCWHLTYKICQRKGIYQYNHPRSNPQEQ